jgi:hypothetical protein
LAGALAVLRDSTVPLVPSADQKFLARALVVLSTGAEGTGIIPQDLGLEAVSAGVLVYPVALARNPPIWVLPYDGYQYDFGDGRPSVEDGRPRKSMWGPAGPYFGIWPSDRRAPLNVQLPPYLNYPFELLGDLTGGRRFEAVNHSPLDDDGRPIRMFDDRSMTGGEVNGILDIVKRHALAHFRSSYTIGFVPSPSTGPREHTLEVKLATKSAGKVIDSKRSAAY